MTRSDVSKKEVLEPTVAPEEAGGEPSEIGWLVGKKELKIGKKRSKLLWKQVVGQNC